MKKLILIATLLSFGTITFAQQAEVKNTCEQTDKMLAFYVTYMVSKDIHVISNENSIEEIFQKIDDKLTTLTNKSCKSGKGLSEITGEIHTLCIKSCESESKISTDEALVKSFKSDCLKVCDVHLLAQQQYVAGIKMAKINPDCTDSKSGAINSLNKAAIDISDKIPSSSNSPARESTSK